jgi:uncharacterized membrane protein (DUF485 family)
MNRDANQLIKGKARTRLSGGRAMALVITLATLVIYLAFIISVGFERPLLARVIVPGLSLGILFGALVIVASCVLTWIYIGWANWRNDGEITGSGG